MKIRIARDEDCPTHASSVIEHGLTDRSKPQYILSRSLSQSGLSSGLGLSEENPISEDLETLVDGRVVRTEVEDI